MELRRIGDFEIEHALSRTLFVAHRGDQRVLLRVTEAPQNMDAMLLVWLSESRLAQTIVHPELGKLLDLGHTDGYVFFAYEYVEQARVLGLDVPFSAAVTIAHKLCVQISLLRTRMNCP